MARGRLIVIVLSITALLVRLAFGLAATVRDRKPYLQIAAPTGRVASGGPVILPITVINPTRLPLRLNSTSPLQDFDAAPSSKGPDGRIRPSRYGRWMVGSLMSGGGPSTTTPLVKPQASLNLRAGFPLGRTYDLSMPGRYTVRIVTQRPIYLVSRKTQITVRSGMRTIGDHLFLAASGEVAPGGAAQSVAKSNKCVLTVVAPYGKLPPSALEPATRNLLPGPLPPTARLVAKAIPAKGGGMPVLLCVWLYTGAKPLSLRLTGNPLVDFRPTKVDGPDGRQGYGLLKTPKPHDGPLPNWKPVPLTAYGTWLTMHAPTKNLKAKTYSLKPHMVYQYTVPVNLSCRFDMTLPGNWGGSYHVRLRLAHSKLRTGWISVHVPPPAKHFQP